MKFELPRFIQTDQQVLRHFESFRTHDFKSINSPLDRSGTTGSCLKTTSDFAFSLALYVSASFASFSGVTSAFGSLPSSHSFLSSGSIAATLFSVIASWGLTICSSWFVTVLVTCLGSVLWTREDDSVSLQKSLGVSVDGCSLTALCSGLDAVSCRHDSFSAESAFSFPFCLLFLFFDDLPDEWLSFFSGSKIITTISNNRMHVHGVTNQSRPRQSIYIGNFIKQFIHASRRVSLTYDALGHLKSTRETRVMMHFGIFASFVLFRLPACMIASHPILYLCLYL